MAEVAQAFCNFDCKRKAMAGRGLRDTILLRECGSARFTNGKESGMHTHKENIDYKIT